MGSSMYLYVLQDPSTMEVRYAGITSDPQSRLSNHLSPSAAGNCGLALYRWLMALKAGGMKPAMRIIAIVEAGLARQTESDYIAALVTQGCSLLNAPHPGPATSAADTSTRLIRMPEDVHRRLKVAAAQRGQTITGLLSGLVLRWLERQDKAS